MNANLKPLWHYKGRELRALTTTVELKGVSIDVEYTLEGDYMAPTATDSGERPGVNVLAAQIGGEDVWSLLGDTSIGERITEMVEQQLSERGL